MSDHFAISTTDVDGVPTVSVQGDLDLTTSPVLRQHLEEAAAEGDRGVAVDLTAVRFFDSSAARVLLREYREGLRRRRPLRITGASRPVRRVLAVLLEPTLERTRPAALRKAARSPEPPLAS